MMCRGAPETNDPFHLDARYDRGSAASLKDQTRLTGRQIRLSCAAKKRK